MTITQGKPVIFRCCFFSYFLSKVAPWITLQLCFHNYSSFPKYGSSLFNHGLEGKEYVNHLRTQSSTFFNKKT